MRICTLLVLLGGGVVLSEEQVEAVEMFHREGQFEPKWIDPEGILNSGIKAHPMILRALKID